MLRYNQAALLVENNKIDKNKLSSDFGHDRPSVYKQTALGDYNIQPAVLQRLRLQNVLDRIEKVGTAERHCCHKTVKVKLNGTCSLTRARVGCLFPSYCYCPEVCETWPVRRETYMVTAKRRHPLTALTHY